jgi:serine/threonine-protein kinase
MADSAVGFWRFARRWARSFTAPRSADPMPASPVPTPTAPGRVLGGYRIERPLGQGAMGALYLAVDPIDQTPRVLKTLALAREFEAEDLPDARARFLREAEAACRLRHPDIVRVYGAGEDRGLAYIVMDPLSGSDLSRYTRPARLLPEPVVLRIVARVAEALAYAHSQGVVHRDVKPANVMVDLGAHRVTITDFGIARLTDGNRTRTGLVIGSPSFMSPEQLAGAQVDGRSDLYSLGVMLFQLLTGRLPYEGASMGELLRAVAGGPARDIRQLRPDAPPALAELLARALHKTPQQRFADGHQFAAALREIDSHWNVTPDTDHGA